MPALLLVAASADAQAACPGSNRVINCGFEIGDPPAAWDPVTGDDFSTSPVAEQGSSSGSMKPAPSIISGIFGTLLSSNCFAVSTPTDFQFGASFRRAVLEDSYCSLDLESFETEECNYWERTGIVSSPSVGVSQNAWVQAEGSGSVVGPFAQLQLQCTVFGPGPDLHPYLFDSAFAGPVAAIEVPTLGLVGIALLTMLLAAAGSIYLRASSSHTRSERGDA